MAMMGGGSSWFSSSNGRPSAADLPYDILEAIFLYSIDVPVGVRPHGGYLASWQSNETMKGLALVCKGWNLAATDVLYHSVSLDSRPRTDLFRRTLAELPQLADKVNYLTLRISPETLSATHDVQRLDDAFALLEALRSCAKTLTHLHIHPLPDLTRPPLFEAMSTLERLQVLVCSSRFLPTVTSLGPDPIAPTLPLVGDMRELHLSHPSHPRLVLPHTLHTLELDFSSSWSAEAFPFHDGVTADGLRKIRLSCDADEDKLWQLLEQCTMLEVCELYFERLVAVDKSAQALRASASTMRQLVFHCNPTVGDLERFDRRIPPLLDRLISSYARLETVSISATDLSPRVISLLPPCLVALEVQAFNHVSTFFFTSQLVHDLRDERYAIGLKSLRLHDAAEAWVEENIDSLQAACQGRGIDFHFDFDSEVGSE
ncbi:hypothetical protein JCM11251_005999 [Rhodosporidiobolus azoricus]